MGYISIINFFLDSVKLKPNIHSHIAFIKYVSFSSRLLFLDLSFPLLSRLVHKNELLKVPVRDNCISDLFFSSPNNFSLNFFTGFLAKDKSIKLGSSYLILVVWDPSFDEDHDREIHEDYGEGGEDKDKTDEEA